jgi:tetratricopeptide (TPR) repeat protein
MWSSICRFAIAGLAGVLALGITAQAAVTAVPAETPQQLDRRFAALAADVYQRTASAAGTRSGLHPDLPTLQRHLAEIRKEDSPVAVVALLRAHRALLAENVDNPLIDNVIDTLLANSDLATAQELLAAARRSGDRFTLSRIGYRFAIHHFDHGNWQAALEFLNGIPSDLGARQSHHALVLTGIALQKLKRHRDSIRFYQQVPAGSPYFVNARLNTAIASIRQDWWTDAQSALRDAIRANGSRSGDEAQNRLYLVLGYLLLHKEYYRDAREAFRSITLESAYANRALLGLSLAAGGQDDFPGALNALTVLKRRDAGDLPTDETYVLLPLVHQKLKRPAFAADAYTEAMAFYEKKLAALDQMLDQDNLSTGDQVSVDAGANVAPDGLPPDISVDMPPYLAANVRMLEQMRTAVNDPRLLARISALLSDHQHFRHRVIRGHLEERRAALRSYLNQCRFGLAKLLDKNEVRN